jgi:hypothetical protein
MAQDITPMDIINELNRVSDMLGLPRMRVRRAPRQRSAQDMASRADQMCRNAIGKEMRIKQTNRLAITGTILEAKPLGMRNRGRSTIQQFEVILECGLAKVRRDFIVEALPR